MDLPPHVHEVLSAARSCRRRKTAPKLLDWALGRAHGATDWRLGNRDDHGVHEATFQVKGGGRVVEAVIHQGSHGLAVNFPSPLCAAAIPTRWSSATRYPPTSPPSAALQ